MSTDDGSIFVESDTIEVAIGDRNPESGERVEPEEKPARRILGGTIGTTTDHGESAGRMRARVILETTVSELAIGMRNSCFSCKHFDQHAWAVFMRKAWATKEGMQTLNNIRAALEVSENLALREQHQGMDGEMDLEHALSSLGICQALTEAHGEKPWIVYPGGSCPQTVPEKGTPFGNAYQPRDSAAEKQSSSAFDAIMRRAQE